MKRPILALIACVAMLLPRLALSVQVQNLYEAQVPVTSQTDLARHAGLVAALQAVLVKISGASEIAAQPSLAEVLNTPERYVDQFRFVTTGTGSASEQAIWVRFDGRALEQLLRSKGLPVWGANRPSVVAWLSIDDKGRRTLLGAGDTTAPVTAFNAAASRRGLPARLPFMDLEDRRRVQPGDVWAGFGEAIQSASLRYRAEAVLTGALTRESDSQWHARWILYSGGSLVKDWDVVGTLDHAVDYGVDLAADELARIFAAPSRGTEAGGPVMVRVIGVRTLEDFMRVNAYMRGLGGVTAVQAAEVTGDEVVLSVSFHGSAQGLARAVAVGDTLAPAQDGADPTELSYRLLK